MPDARIRVIAFRPGDRTVYYCQWTDPASGRKKTRTTGTAIKRDAERFRVKLEDELNAGEDAIARRLTWPDFRLRVESDFLPDKRENTRERYTAAMNALERHINPNLMTGIDADAIARFKADLRERGNAEATVAAQLRHLKALLRWGMRNRMLRSVPHIEIPTLEAPARGRPVVGEEFDRLIAAVTKVVGEARAEGWRHLLRGLYLGGMRIGEAVRLTWDDPQGIRVELDRAYPLLFIPSRLQKGRRDTVTPLTPDFAALLAETPPEARRGFVFNPQGKSGERPSQRATEATVRAIGRKSGIVVKRDPTEYVSAQDLRRSFCFRWSMRVLPQVLMTLARHRSVTTTLTYYAQADAETTAEAVWAAVAGLANASANTRDLAALPR